MNTESSASSDEEWDIKIDFFDNYYVPGKFWVYSEAWQNYNYSPGEYFETAGVKLERVLDKSYEYFRIFVDTFYYFIRILYAILCYNMVCIEPGHKQFALTLSCQHSNVEDIINVFYVWRKCAICTSYKYILWEWWKMVKCSDCKMFMHIECHKALLRKSKPQIDGTIISTDCTKTIIIVNVSPAEVANKMHVECNDISQEHGLQIHNLDKVKDDLVTRSEMDEESSGNAEFTIEVIPPDVASYKIHVQECKGFNDEAFKQYGSSSETTAESLKFNIGSKCGNGAPTDVVVDSKYNSAKTDNKLLKSVKRPTAKSKIPIGEAPSQKITCTKTRTDHKSIDLYIYGTLLQVHNCGVDEFFDDGQAVFAYCGSADYDDDRFAAGGSGARFVERFGKPRGEHRLRSTPSYMCLQELPDGGKVYMLITKETGDSPTVDYHRAMLSLKQHLDGAGDARLTMPPLGVETDGITVEVFAEKIKMLFLRKNIGVRLCSPDRMMCRQLVNAFFSPFPMRVKRKLHPKSILFF